MVKKREKNRITKERVYEWYGILLIAAFVLTPLVCWAHTADDPDISPLIAGQDILVGQVRIWNDDQNLSVKYQTNRPWYMTETHLYVRRRLPFTPVAPGSFTRSYENPNGFSKYTYTISLSALDVEGGDSVYILAQAVVVNTDTGDSETAWKKGTQIPGPGGGRAMYNTYQIQKVPWLRVSISETRLTWDIFKPGRYMSLGPVLRIASNVAVAILFGTGGSDSALGPAVRKGSLLSKNRGTSGDKITLWATCRWGEPSRPHRGDPGLVPAADQISINPKDLFRSWIEFRRLNGYKMTIREKKRTKTFSWYNMINVDPSHSQGNYFEQFVITISAKL